MAEKLKKMHSIDQRLEDLQVNFLCCRICLKSSICPSFSQQIMLLLNALLEVRPLQGASESSQNTAPPQFICFNKKCSTYVSTIFSVSHSLQVFSQAALSHSPCVLQHWFLGCVLWGVFLLWLLVCFCLVGWWGWFVCWVFFVCFFSTLELGKF